MIFGSEAEFKIQFWILQKNKYFEACLRAGFGCGYQKLSFQKKVNTRKREFNVVSRLFHPPVGTEVSTQNSACNIDPPVQ